MEVHSENYFGRGGPPHYYLAKISEKYPLSIHGVGLSLGSDEPLHDGHLQNLKTLIERYQPALISEHLSWGAQAGQYLNDLAPLPYTEESLESISKHISQTQDYLGRQILIENVSGYLEYKHSDIPEWEFIVAVAKKTGCGILLDVNNVYVNSRNQNFNPLTYISAVPKEFVQEIHLAGHTLKKFEEGEIIIDTHDKPVAEPVWTLYQKTIELLGAKPTLIEWDTALPTLEILTEQAHRADHLMEQALASAA